MRAEVKEGALCVNLQDLIEALSDSERADIIQHLACHSQIITEVANQIIDGMTSECWHGAKGIGGDPDCTHGIDGARMRIAKASSDIAALEIKAMHTRIKMAEDLASKGWDAYHEAIDSRRRA